MPLYSPLKTPRWRYGKRYNRNRTRTYPPPSSDDELTVSPSNDQALSETHTEHECTQETFCSSAHVDSDAIDDKPEHLVLTIPYQKLVLKPEEMLRARLRQVRKELTGRKQLLRKAEQRLQRLRQKAKSRNSCPLCGNIFNSPHNLACGHVFCARCISEYAEASVRQEKNVCCPVRTCRKYIGTFTPVISYHIKNDVADMLKDQGLESPAQDRLQWPTKLHTIPTPLPFPLRND
ncbi:hypothetical protein C8R42DRAFT_637006 [Lentinula raphanica]|nr:hypothetical protein C8R42DRAFT_637006 [Lentinula raphanica]